MKLGLISLALCLGGCAVGVATVDDTSGQGGGTTAVVSAGKASYENHSCGSCHGVDLAGSDQAVSGTATYGSNITPDPMGIGGWTDDQIYAAIRLGKGFQGRTLCQSMLRYKISDTELKALVAYMKSVPPVAHQVAQSDCSSLGNPAQDAAPSDPPPEPDASAPPQQDAGGNSCNGYAPPTTKASCHACKTSVCQANGCYGGYYCDLNQTKCVPPPNGC